MEIVSRIRKFIYVMRFAFNPPPDYHDTLMRNMKVLIEQEKIRERWCEILGKDPADDGYTLDGGRIDKERPK